MEFFYVYKALAHPQKDGYVEPFDLAERLLHVKEAKRRLDTEVPWLCDSRDNALKHAFGGRNNSEFVIGVDGKIAVSRTWSDPAALREDLEKLVGAVEEPTTIADLKLKPQAPAKLAPKGIAPKVERPSRAALTPRGTWGKECGKYRKKGSSAWRSMKSTARSA